jgi:hypothetical protein
MKSPYFAAAAIILILVFAIAGCAPASQTSVVSKPIGSREYVTVGEVVLRVETTADLPDMFGNTNYFGGLSSRGFSELCYVGLNAAKQPVFRRRDVHVSTPMPQQSKAPPQPKAPPPPLPEATVEFVVDYSKGRVVSLRGRTVEIIDATPAGVTFSVQ